MSNFYQNTYNPDVLSCLANLSSDEVFTPPEIVNRMLDLLPKDLWRDSSIKFLDPACKSGVFLREIAKRLIVGLENEFPDLEKRLDHIFRQQLYGIAITELTSLLSRRSLYGSKYPNSKLSIPIFNNPEGNIKFNIIEHYWKGKSCKFCGASKSEYKRGMGLETHAYEFIHKERPEVIFNMRFDVVVGNPPYQLSDGGAQSSASPIYHKFVEQAIKLNPRYITMIIPSRWFTGGKGLDDFRVKMLNDRRIREIHDFHNASDCFVGVDIKGGVNYFLWEKQYNGDCIVHTHQNDNIISIKKRNLKHGQIDIFIRHNEAIDILEKVLSFKEKKLSEQISSRKPFGLSTNFKDFSPRKSAQCDIRIYAFNKTGYISEDKIIRNKKWVEEWKVLVPYAVGVGDMSQDIVKPFLAKPNSCCTETYLVALHTNEKIKAENLITYFNTKFFHFLLGLRKVTQHTTASVYSFVPVQDFSRPWSDEALYKKYQLSKEDVAYIEKSVRDLE